MSSLYPVGCVLPYAGQVTPTSEAALIAQGFVPCDGRQLANDDPQYQSLQKVIGNGYGGTKTAFCVPDYRGIFLRGTDGGAGVDPNAATRTPPQPTLAIPGNSGDAVGSMQPGGLQSHTHTYASAEAMHAGIEMELVALFFPRAFHEPVQQRAAEAF